MPYTTTWHSDPYKRTIDIQVVVSSEEQLRQHTPQAALSPIVDLVNLAECGGLSGSQHPPQDAMARIVTHAITGRRVRWVLEVEGVAPTTLRNIKGSLSYFDSAIASLDAVSVQAPSTLIAAKDQVPQRFFAPLAFHFADDRQDYRSLQIDIGFERAPRELIDRVEMEAFGMWICAASAGCFCDEDFPPELCKVYLGEHRHGTDNLILELDEMILPEPIAVDSLLNTFTWAHHHITRISRVEFYD